MIMKAKDNRTKNKLPPLLGPLTIVLKGSFLFFFAPLFFTILAFLWLPAILGA